MYKIDYNSKEVIIMNQIHLVSHPLISHKLTILRDKQTESNYFRHMVKEITQLLMFPATQALALQHKQITTPVTTMTGQTLQSSVIVIPIMRAGLGMLDAFTDMIPTAQVGHIGIVRDEKTLQPTTYIEKIPFIAAKTSVFILDPMLATGGTLVKAIDRLKEKGAKNITYLGLVGVQTGIDYVVKHHPDVVMYLAARDSHLNEKGYIVPGLGDCGDRLYGTEH
jgi:uracil phosphoribosyltransferase